MPTRHLPEVSKTSTNQPTNPPNQPTNQSLYKPKTSCTLPHFAHLLPTKPPRSSISFRKSSSLGTTATAGSSTSRLSSSSKRRWCMKSSAGWKLAVVVWFSLSLSRLDPFFFWKLVKCRSVSFPKEVWQKQKTHLIFLVEGGHSLQEVAWSTHSFQLILLLQCSKCIHLEDEKELHVLANSSKLEARQGEVGHNQPGTFLVMKPITPQFCRFWRLKRNVH